MNIDLEMGLQFHDDLRCLATPTRSKKLGLSGHIVVKDICYTTICHAWGERNDPVLLDILDKENHS